MLKLCKKIEDKYGCAAGYGTNFLDVLWKYRTIKRDGVIKRFIKRRITELRRAKYKGLPERYCGKSEYGHQSMIK